MKTHEKFWSLVKKQPENGCWIWTGGMSNGVPALNWNGKTRYAFHVLSEIEGRELNLREMKYVHACKTPACIRPDPAHVSPISKKDLAARAIEGRWEKERRTMTLTFAPGTGVAPGTGEGNYYTVLEVAAYGRDCGVCLAKYDSEGKKFMLFIEKKMEGATEHTLEIALFCFDCGEKRLIHRNRVRECVDGGASSGERLDVCLEDKRSKEEPGKEDDSSV